MYGAEDVIGAGKRKCIFINWFYLCTFTMWIQEVKKERVGVWTSLHVLEAIYSGNT